MHSRGAKLHLDCWKKSLRRKKAINYLTLSGAREAAELFSGLPFQYWAGTNSFGDQFDLLYLSISVTQYLKLKLDAETIENKHRFSLIADALQETGNYVRFIAADMEEGEWDAVSTPTLDITSAVVERALLDFETLTKSH